jgi:putative flippase GtrA
MTTISQVSTVDPPQSMAGGCPQSIFRKPRVRPARWAAAAPAGRPAAQSSVDFAVNRRLVFAAPGARPLRAAAARYAGLTVVLFAASYLLLAAFTALGVGLLPAKLLTEVLLVTASYQVQRRTVFTPWPRPRPVPTDGRREVHPVPLGTGGRR